MFGIGMNEFLLIMLLAVVLIGPKQLPEVARGLAKLLAAFRRATADLRSAVSEEINARPEFRELSKIRDEISGDMNKIGDRARNYMEKEFQDEQRIAGSVERDVRKVGENFVQNVDAAGQEGSAAGTGQDGGKSLGPHVPATSHAPWNVQYKKFYTTSEGSGSAAAPAAEGSVVTEAPAAQPAAAPAANSTEPDSPEDAYQKERERGRA